MDVAVTEEPQKKVFRARKTMKLSDRQQLETLHNILPPSSVSPPMVNGKHSEGGLTEGENNKENEQRVASRCPSPPVLSPSPAPREEAAVGPLSPSVKPAAEASEADMAKSEGEDSKEDEKDREGSTEKDDATMKDAGPLLEGKCPPDATEDTQGEGQECVGMQVRLESEEVAGTDTELEMVGSTLGTSPLVAPSSMTSPSPPMSPSNLPESDQEVKEGFLVLSEEDDSQGEREDEKENITDKDKQHGEDMDVDGCTADEKEDPKESSPPPAAALPSAEAGGRQDAGTPSGRKRTLSGNVEAVGQSDGAGTVESRKNKKVRTEKDELEAQLELKISGEPGSRQRLEKVLQHLVTEQLRVLQLTVFDRTLQELRERVDRIDCATKHQHSLNALQAKIARLAKKFGAANQAKENTTKSQPVTPPSSIAATTTTTPTVNTTPTSRMTVREMLETKRGEGQQGQSSTVGAISSAGAQNQRKVASAPATSPVLVRALGSSPATASTTSNSSTLSTSVTKSTLSCSLSRPAPSAVKLTRDPAPGSVPPLLPPQPMSAQPLLTLSTPQTGSMSTGRSPGVEIIPASSLVGVPALGKPKISSPGTTFILPKTMAATSPCISLSSSSSSSSSLPAGASSVMLPQISLPRAVYSGGNGMISVPSPGVSASSARMPAQCAPVVGVTSSSSLPTSSVPVATGGHTSGLAASGPVSTTTMASKTDGQAVSRSCDSTAAKTLAQVPRTSGSGAVIDLTEDDDDVQVTGVKRAPVQQGPNVTASLNSSTLPSGGQRAPGPTVSLSSSTSGHTQPAVRSPTQGQHMSNGPQLTVHHRPQQPCQDVQLKKHASTAPGVALSSSSGPIPLPPLPPTPAPLVRLPPEAAHTSPPQQPQLKLARVQSQNGIVLSWCVAETDRTCAAVDSYHLYACHLDPAAVPASQWKKIGEVKALALPMACTLTQFVSGSKYYFAICARDVYGRFGPFCDPQGTDVIAPSSSV